MTAALAFVSTMAMAQAKLTAEPLNVVPGEDFHPAGLYDFR